MASSALQLLPGSSHARFPARVSRGSLTPVSAAIRARDSACVCSPAASRREARTGLAREKGKLTYRFAVSCRLQDAAGAVKVTSGPKVTRLRMQHLRITAPGHLVVPAGSLGELVFFLQRPGQNELSGWHTPLSAASRSTASAPVRAAACTSSRRCSSRASTWPATAACRRICAAFSGLSRCCHNQAKHHCRGPADRAVSPPDHAIVPELPQPMAAYAVIRQCSERLREVRVQVAGGIDWTSLAAWLALVLMTKSGRSCRRPDSLNQLL